MSLLGLGFTDFKIGFLGLQSGFPRLFKLLIRSSGNLAFHFGFRVLRLSRIESRLFRLEFEPENPGFGFFSSFLSFSNSDMQEVH